MDICDKGANRSANRAIVKGSRSPMQVNRDNEVQNKSAAVAARSGQSDARSSKLINCPFKVRIDGAPPR
jgi:hypothetical protein